MLVELFTLLAIGLLVGILVGGIGMGAGIIMMPALTTFMGMSIQSAVGITLAMQTLPVGIWGAYEYYESGHLKLWDAGVVAVGMITGIGIGSLFATRGDIPPSVLRKFVGGFATIVGIYMLLDLRTW